MITRSQWASAAHVVAALACWCIAAAATAQTGGSNRVFSDMPYGYDFDITHVNAPAHASTMSPCPSCWKAMEVGASAVADAAALTWRTSAGWSGRAEGLQSHVRAESTWDAIVQPGSSGLSAGAPVTLTVQVRWDGTLGASFNALGGPSGYDMRSQVAGFVGMGIADIDADPEGGGAPQWRIAGVIDSGLSTALCSDPAACGGTTYAYTHRTSNLDLSEFVLGSQSWSWSGGSFSDTVVPGADGAASASLSVDTGMLSFSFLTAVGNHLVITGFSEVDMMCIGSGGRCATWGDFGHTFQAALIPEVPGVVIEGLAPVPEPGTPMLLAAGLAALWLVRRRAPDRLGAASA